MFLHKHHESLLLNDYLIFIPPENENELKFFLKIPHDRRK